MLVIFRADPLDPRQPDAMYAAEAAAAQVAGFERALIAYEALVDDDPARAVRSVTPRSEELVALYRGWMLRPSHYERLYEALAATSTGSRSTRCAIGTRETMPEWNRPGTFAH